MPQHFARDPSLPLTVRRLVGSGRARTARRCRSAPGAARRSPPWPKTQVTALSGGELKRVLLARAIAGKPDLLLLDEPVAGVDLAGEAALYHLIAQLRDETGCGVLLVSHDLHVVMAQANRVVCLNRHVCCEGTAGAVVRDPAFVDLFGPRIAGELALYHHHHDHDHAPSGEVIEAHGHAMDDFLVARASRAPPCWARPAGPSAVSCCGGAWPIWANPLPIWAFWARVWAC